MASSACLFLSLIIFTIAASTAFSAPSAASTPSAAENSTLFALLDFKASIVYPPGSMLSSWSTSSHFCTWPGITCTSGSHQVTELSLAFGGLNGTLSPQIANLQELSSLSLSENSLFGQLPSSLGRLKRLEYLDLSSNQFSGLLPSSFGQMKSLRNLNLSNNQLSGTLPSSLVQTHMSLQHLSLKQNQLSGPLPSSLVQMNSLQDLDLSQNQISGPLPPSLGLLTNLRNLDFSENQLFGLLPPSLGHMTSLHILSLYHNKLSGPLPPSLGQLKNLTNLYLSQNQLSGPLPPSLAQMQSLQFLNLARNQLSGHLPTSIFGQTELLSYLDLSENQLSGPLPPSLAQVQSLQYLNLSQNQLSGPLPTAIFGQTELLSYLDLSKNQLSGPLPPSLGQMQSLQYLDLSQNQLSGGLPASIGQMKLLSHLDLSENHLSGPLPLSLGQMLGLQYLDSSQNQLSGHLPSSLMQVTYLNTLNLQHNQLSGSLPSFIGKMESLNSLDLSHNQLSGPLPMSPDSFMYLSFLNLSYNQLEGLIPSQVYDKFSLASFLGNSRLYAPFPFTSPSPLSFIVHNKHAKRNTLLEIVFVVGPVSLLVFFSMWQYCFKRRDPGSNFVAPQYKAWTIKQMRVATNNFDVANIIGLGAVSVCYLGTMESAQGISTLAFKRLNEGDYGEEDDEARKSFVNEFKTICKLRHRNVVKVLGYCVERGEVALVMEYMEGGDLDKRLHNEANRLSWEERFSVALDVAEGLVYLHHEYDQPIIHCDIKPKNILLRLDMVAKISDFGLAKLMGVNKRGDMSMSKLRGSFGYIAPEYGMGLRISTKIDVYSFGMLLLELVTGVRPTSPMLENEAMNLRTWVQTIQASRHVGKVLQNYDNATLQEAKELLRLGVQCTHDVAKKRPSMYIVREFILQLKTRRL